MELGSFVCSEYCSSSGGPWEAGKCTWPDCSGPPFFRIFIFFDEVFNSARGTTYLMRDDGATDVNVRP